MDTSGTFKQFLKDHKISEDKASTISYRYGRITKALNTTFRGTDSKTANTLQVGSYGRYTGIKNISDLDMLYIMPSGKWNDYNVSGGQTKLLQDVKSSIENTYPATTIKVDRCVVTVTFSDSHIDVQPVFEVEDQDYKYPDTYKSGSWKITKPRKEMSAMTEAEQQKNRNLRRLCKMARSWKNKSGVAMGGLLIDTLAYNFLHSTDAYDSSSYSSYDLMCRDFFEYLKDRPKEQKSYNALGSNQKVNLKKSFRRKSKKAYELAEEAVTTSSDKTEHRKWRDIFGKDFPQYQNAEEEARALNEGYQDTEEYIESYYRVDISHEVKIDCEIKQNGFREGSLRDFLMRKIRLKPQKSLRFYIKDLDVPPPYSVKWKVTNRGDNAIKRNCVRGQIVDDKGSYEKKESTNFTGSHFVECYIIKDNIVVASDAIDVPISA